MSLVSSLNIAQQALTVSQAAITVISNNISNVDNENYKKLSVELSDVITYSNVPSVVAQADSLSGVQISQIQRYSNNFLQNYYWNENSTYSYLDKYSSIATNVEDVMNELQNTGLSKALSDFYSSIDALNDDPTNLSARENFVTCAQNVCSVFNTYYNNLNDIKESLVGNYQVIDAVDDSEIGNETTTVNNLLDQLANVNEGILKTTAAGITSTSLLDERDALIKNLTGYINVDVELNNNGTANIELNEKALIGGSDVVGYLDATTGTAAEPVTMNIVDASGTTIYSNVNDDITGGSIAAIIEACGSGSSNFTINDSLDKLNNLALSFASIFNDIQTGDPEGDGTTALCLNPTGTQLIVATEDLFLNSATGVADANINAQNISINSEITNHPYLVASARVTIDATHPISYYQDDVGNNANSTLMAESRTTKYSSVIKHEDLDSQTIEGYLSTMISSVGYSVSNINNNLTTQEIVFNEVKSQLQSETGVNLDEELTDLIKFQRAYQAAARVFDVCNQLLENLINLGS